MPNTGRPGRSTIHKDDGDPRHGTANGYSNLGCGCGPCKQANSTTLRKNRARLRARPIPDRVHGSLNGYQNYACRCKQCKKTAATVRAESRAAQAAERKRLLDWRNRYGVSN